ncbi:MAG: Hpt domain-containing protein [Deltaproteobacteria bacterium]|nr:Hpt domain-containing protein [Deltaproteobacteria bacterium]
MDWEAAARELGLRRSEFLEVVGLFLETSGADLEALEEALAQGDLEGAAARAHSLKGAAASLQLRDIARLALNLETAVKDAALAEASGQVVAVREKLRELATAAGP